MNSDKPTSCVQPVVKTFVFATRSPFLWKFLERSKIGTLAANVILKESNNVPKES